LSCRPPHGRKGGGKRGLHHIIAGGIDQAGCNGAVIEDIDCI
jgi:hypothetical protein